MPDRAIALNVLVLATAVVALSACAPPKMEPRPASATQPPATLTEFDWDSFQCRKLIRFWYFDRGDYVSCMKAYGHVED